MTEANYCVVCGEWCCWNHKCDPKVLRRVEERDRREEEEAEEGVEEDPSFEERLRSGFRGREE